MSEKVLGFKEITAKQEDGNVFYKIPANNLVPVVSLELLENAIEYSRHPKSSSWKEGLLNEKLLREFLEKNQAGG